MSDALPTTERSNPASADLGSRSTREILELMNAEDASVPDAVGAELPSIERAVAAIVDRLHDGGRLVYLGAGTSGRIAAMEAAEAPPTFGVAPEIVIGVIAGGSGAVQSAREVAEDDEAAGATAIAALDVAGRDAVVGVTASGATRFVLGAVREAAARGALTIGVCSDADAPLNAAVDVAICPVVGPEVVTGSTRLKAGTAAKLVLNMLTTAAMVRLGHVHGNLMIDVQATNAKLRDRARRIVTEVTGAAPDEVRAALEASGWSARAAIDRIRGESSQDARPVRSDQR
jgi:N-acetylmuramic acid 6-phosphate etherase